MTDFSVTPWPEIESFYDNLIHDHGMTFLGPMLDLARSVVTEGAADKLAAHTSMHDLVVTTTPVAASPDWLRVSLQRGDVVRISHQTVTGPGDSLERTNSDLLPLFWRFAIEKWGVRPARDSR